MKTFNIGDRVTWNSSSSGSWKTKTGVIVEIIAKGKTSKLAGSGWPRDHESYIVSVESGKRVIRPKMYWPRVSKLELVTQ